MQGESLLVTLAYFLLLLICCFFKHTSRYLQTTSQFKTMCICIKQTFCHGRKSRRLCSHALAMALLSVPVGPDSGTANRHEQNQNSSTESAKWILDNMRFNMCICVFPAVIGQKVIHVGTGQYHT